MEQDNAPPDSSAARHALLVSVENAAKLFFLFETVIRTRCELEIHEHNEPGVSDAFTVWTRAKGLTPTIERFPDREELTGFTTTTVRTPSGARITIYRKGADDAK